MICSVEACDGEVRCKGLCNKHYHVLKQQRKLKLCACGCGEQTSYRFKHGHHTRLFSSAEQSRRGRMNDGSKLRDTGNGKSYRKVGGRHEHRVVMERKLGRALGPHELVHHRDRKHRNNALGNLELTTRKDHINEHRAEMMAARRLRG